MLDLEETGQKVHLSRDQREALPETVGDHPHGIDLVEMTDGYLRVDFLDPEGNVVRQAPLFPPS